MLAYIIPILLVVAGAYDAKANQVFKDPVRIGITTTATGYLPEWADITQYETPQNALKLSGRLDAASSGKVGWLQFESYREQDAGRTMRWTPHGSTQVATVTCFLVKMRDRTD
jgi:hypothetical protein